MEHRWGERRSINLAVTFVMMPSTAGTGRVTNISSTGAFMETRMPLRLLSLLYLQPTASAEGENRRITATVVRRNATGVGLEWCEFEVQTLKFYLRLATEALPVGDDHRWRPPIERSSTWIADVPVGKDLETRRAAESISAHLPNPSPPRSVELPSIPTLPSHLQRRNSLPACDSTLPQAGVLPDAQRPHRRRAAH